TTGCQDSPVVSPYARACAVFARIDRPVNTPSINQDGQVRSPRALWISTDPAYTRMPVSMNAGTDQCIHSGSPNHAATSMSATKLIANATSPAKATPAVIVRMNRGSSGLIREDFVARSDD